MTCFEFRLIDVNLETSVDQVFYDLTHMGSVFLFQFVVNQYIIQVCGTSIIKKVLEGMIDVMLKCSQGIAESKGHNCDGWSHDQMSPDELLLTKYP